MGNSDWDGSIVALQLFDATHLVRFGCVQCFQNLESLRDSSRSDLFHSNYILFILLGLPLGESDYQFEPLRYLGTASRLVIAFRRNEQR